MIEYIRFSLRHNPAKGKETAQEKVVEAAAGKAHKYDSQNIPINYNSQWKEIIRMMNPQKAVTTVSQNTYDQIIISHRSNDPTPKVDAIYCRLKYKPKLRKI